MTDQEKTERKLVARARDGDNDAYEDLVRMHQTAIYCFLFRLSRDAEEAVELTQSTFVKAWFSLGRFRGEASFKTYLYRIAANGWRNSLRDRSRRRTIDPEQVPLVSGEDPHRTSEAAQEQERLWSHVNLLPARQKEIVVLRIREGFSFEDAAGIMGCTAGSARANYHHAVRKLVAALAEEER